jgi:hypothetical protein
MAKKKTTKKKSEGLGDTVAKFTKATKIDKLVKFVAGEDCGCSSRRERLNKLFPYNSNIKCLQEDEYHILSGWFAIERSTLTPNEQAELRKIYNRVFNKKTSSSSCSSCVRDMVDRLRTVYNEYESKNK